MEAKQLEHVANERLILEECSGCPFLVRLIAAYQDEGALYLLQVRLPLSGCLCQAAVGLGWNGVCAP